MRTPRTRVFATLGICAALASGPFAAFPAAADVANLRHDQWGLETVGAPAAWETTRGSGVTVALLDTGVRTDHPDLGSVTVGSDFTGQDLAPGSEHYGVHGTMMAGLIAASGHGVEHRGGVMGVAPDADILSVRVALEEDDPDRGGSARGAERADALAAGIRYAVAEGAQVISVPLSDANTGSHGDGTEQRAIDHAVGNGVVVVVSGGAGGTDDAPAYPAAYDGVLAVGAVDQDGLLTESSSRQESIALTAPGHEVTALDTGGGYTTVEGSGAAAAFASGVAALVRSQYPQLNPAQVTEALTSGAEPAATAPGEPGHGAGVLNAPGALAAAARIAEDVPVFDPDIAEEATDEPPVPAWVPWAGGAVLAAALATAGGLALRRRLANPYGLPERETAAEDGVSSERTRRRKPRGGRRRRSPR